MLRQTFPPYHQQSLYWQTGQSLLLALRLLLRNRISTGPQLQELAKRMAQKYPCNSLFLLGSGRCGITIFLQALKENRSTEKEILLPFYICPSVLEAIRRAGFSPSFLPIKDNLNLSLDGLNEELAARAAALIIPHIYGYPADTEALIRDVHSLNPEIAILDDAAAAYDVRQGGVLRGCGGDGGLLSFSQGKLLNASGGGVLLLHNKKVQKEVEKLYDQLPCQSSSAKLRDFLQVLWRYGYHRFSDPIAYWLTKVSSSRRLFAGNYHKMANLDAALLLAIWNRIPEIHKQRSEIIHFLHKQLVELEPLFFAQNLTSGRPPVSRFYFGIKGHALTLDKGCGIIRDNPLFLFLRSRGIKAYSPYLPIPGQGNAYKQLWQENQWLYSLVGLPINFQKTPEQHQFLVDTIKEYLDTHG